MAHEILPYFGLRHPISSGTHILACILSIVATYLLWQRARGHFRLQLTSACFGLSMVLLYAASATFHALQLPWEQLRFFLMLDMAAIYVLIAGTYTPPLLVLLPRGLRRYAFFCGIWLVAAVGIVIKVITFESGLSYGPYWIGTLLYLGMGWLALAIVLDLTRAVGFQGLQWAIYGGLAYTTGAVVEMQGGLILWPGVIGTHELFHVCVMAGTFFHFLFIWNHVLPYALASDFQQNAIRVSRPFRSTASLVAPEPKGKQ